MTPEVSAAIEEIRQAFAGNTVDVVEEPQGGASVVVRDLYIGDQYTPSTSWVGFSIPFTYPSGDIYPNHIDPAVRRADGSPHRQGFHINNTFKGAPSIMVSRASNRRSADTFSAAIKLATVLTWIRDQK